MLPVAAQPRAESNKQEQQRHKDRRGCVTYVLLFDLAIRARADLVPDSLFRKREKHVAGVMRIKASASCLPSELCSDTRTRASGATCWPWRIRIGTNLGCKLWVGGRERVELVVGS